MTFISKFEILLRRLRASWMDTMPKVELTAEFREQLAKYNRVGAERARAVYTQWLADCNTAAASGSSPPARPPEADWTDRTPASQDILDKWNRICQDRHMFLCPFTNNFIALFFIIQSELSDGQRERLTSELHSKEF